jgi:phosphoribosyl-ATP pyrophosphohydrolase/phosphoribosyl-AMP cyclohydrolase
VFDLSTLDWQKMSGIIPAIIQDADNGKVLMLGYMNPEALSETLALKEVVFYSRSRQGLWRKGEKSGNVLKLISMSTDCDADSLLILVKPAGPTCHYNTSSCFSGSSFTLGFLTQLEKIVLSRKIQPRQTSYVSKLLQQGINRVAQKVGEEGVEVALAAVTPAMETLEAESADLLFHLIVLLVAQERSLMTVVRILQDRHSQ